MKISEIRLTELLIRHLILMIISPEDSEEGTEWGDEDDATEEDETSDITESESSGRNIFSD